MDPNGRASVYPDNKKNKQTKNSKNIPFTGDKSKNFSSGKITQWI